MFRTPVPLPSTPRRSINLSDLSNPTAINSNNYAMSIRYSYMDSSCQEFSWLSSTSVRVTHVPALLGYSAT